MNFSPFTGHIPATIPAIHQFAAKFGYEGGTGTLVQGQDVSTRYHTGTTANVSHFNQHHAALGMDVGAKFRQQDNVVVSLNNVPNSVGVTLAGLSAMHTVNTGVKYQTISTTSSGVGLNNLGHQYTGQITIPYSQHPTSTGDTIQQQGQQLMKTEQRSTNGEKARENNNGNSYSQQSRETEMTTQEMMNTIIQQQQAQNQTTLHQQSPQQQQQLVVVLHETKEPHTGSKPIKQETRDHREHRGLTNGTAEFLSALTGATSTMSMPTAWQSLAAPGSAVADYLSQLPASALPLGLHHLLKYSTATDGKRDDANGTVNNLITAAVAANGLNTVMPTNGVSGVVVQTANLGSLNQNAIINTTQSITPSKKKKKKKPPKEKKARPKPGEIRLTTALDGSTLYCCPECHMAYPERGMLEQHLVGHTMERRFICDICNAALKRKDHLTRHKQSHNPERPYVCTVCLKAFKRKEQLTLHFVIHSGEKRHICQECGKGFYRKDHLRKHTRSHIARRVKAELSQQGSASTPASLAPPAPAPAVS